MPSTVAKNPLESRSILFMKVGDHAGESFDTILRRKRAELDAAGKIFWGYGGTACHPLTQVQPFMRFALEQGDVPILIMQTVHSTFDQDRFPAEEYSEDGVIWKPVPKGITVTGSRYALVLDEVVAGDFMMDPRDFEVGIGPSRGKRADEYLLGRTDKACLVRTDKPKLSEPLPEDLKKITHFAKLQKPYAVMLR